MSDLIDRYNSIAMKERRPPDPQEWVGMTLVSQDGERRIVKSIGIKAREMSSAAGQVFCSDTAYFEDSDGHNGTESVKKIQDEIALSRWRLE